MWRWYGAVVAVTALMTALTACGGGGDGAATDDPAALELALEQGVSTALLRAFLSSQRSTTAAERTEAIRQLRLRLATQGLTCSSVDRDATLEITRTASRAGATAAEQFARELVTQRRWSREQFGEEFRIHREREAELATQTSSCPESWNAELNQRMGGAASAAYEDAVQRLRRDGVLL